MNCTQFIICPLLPNELQRKREGLASINYLDIIAMFHVLFMFMQSYYRSSFWPGMVITSSNWCLYQNISGQWTKVRYLNDHGPTFQHKAKVLDSRSSLLFSAVCILRAKLLVKFSPRGLVLRMKQKEKRKC